MTSSLVGSEMCIRDRPITVKAKKLGASVVREDVYVRVDETIKPGSYSAVSYTHLTLPTICSV
eukprot:12813805-Prorocentrum_lima.AAC.1